MSTSIALTFSTSNGKSKVFNIPNAKKTLTDNVVKDAMILIKDSSVFSTSNGDLSGLRKAVFSEVIKKEFDLN